MSPTAPTNERVQATQQPSPMVVEASPLPERGSTAQSSAAETTPAVLAQTSRNSALIMYILLN